MTPSFLKKLFCFAIFAFFAFPFSSVRAQEFFKDISISPADVRVAGNVLKGDTVRVYVTVQNHSYFDLSGVVKFYDEKTSSFIGPDQPVSILAQKTDDVFVDWSASSVGSHPIAIRVVPWHSDGDDPSNNKITKSVYVDTDSDGDGAGDSVDPDDDNDGTPDSEDDFPYDPSESEDTDGDGIGNNADTDDDGDGVPDVEDVFPVDPTESKDTDGDGAGDNRDQFPYNSDEWSDADADGLGDNADPNDENHSPIPFIQMDKTKVRVGQSLTFNALKSSDPDGEVTKYEWNFGDGVGGMGVIVEHVYEKTGKYIATLTVTDNLGESRQQQIQVKVTWSLLALLLVICTILLILLLLGLIIPRSRFHHKKLLEVHHVDRFNKG
ncbi:PKD domain-containing protein [Candidatus Peregrinibacteria bacterium]|nr:PKD domain-containing protein [Candidatus Peregrinibacteria bacterium]